MASFSCTLTPKRFVMARSDDSPLPQPASLRRPIAVRPWRDLMYPYHNGDGGRRGTGCVDEHEQSIGVDNASFK